MKIIDSKGRLFGIVNVIDFLVILFCIFLVWGLFSFASFIKNPMNLAADKEVQRIKMEKLRGQIHEEVTNKLNAEYSARYSARFDELDKDKKNLNVWIEGFKEGFKSGHE